MDREYLNQALLEGRRLRSAKHVSVAEWERHLVPIESESSRQPDLLSSPENRYLARLIKPGIKVLDAGCGNGRYVFAFARAEAFATGVDFSPKLVEKVQISAKRKKLHRAKAVVGDMLSLPFESGSFDLYTSFGVYEHFTRQQHSKLFAEAYRVLKPGGIIYLEVPHLWSPWTIRRQLRYWFRKLSPPEIVWQRHISRRYFCRCGAEAGFECVECHVLDAQLGFEKGFSFSRSNVKGLPNPFYWFRGMFTALAERCDRKEWLGHTLVYVGKKPVQEQVLQHAC